MKKKITQIFTVLLFISLIGGFVAYRAGMLRKASAVLQTSPNGGVVKVTQDSVTRVDSIKLRQMMWSSKSAIIIDKIPTRQDSAKVLRDIMYGSKSGKMIDLKEFRTETNDTILKDTLTNDKP